MSNGAFVISLDFELFWGVRDKRSIASYGANLLGVRQAIPGMLALFQRYGVHATFATVGLLACESRKALTELIPTQRPRYADPRLDPFLDLDAVGQDERSDPYHFAPSLVRQIRDTEGMEVGCHTFAHYYCLEQGADPSSFRADLQAAQQAFATQGVQTRSLVFPRNQYAPDYLAVAAEMGIQAYRGNPDHPFYRTEAQSQESPFKRLGRLADAYLNVSGPNGMQPAAAPGLPLNVPASRFLRPHRPSQTLRAGWQVARIQLAMRRCAEQGLGYHLWWHPHNFGAGTEFQLAMLERVLQHYVQLRERFGMPSLTMLEVAQAQAQAQARTQEAAA